MKAYLLCYASRTRRLPSPPSLPFRLLAWLTVLASTCSFLTAAEVHTLTGGPAQFFPSSPAGYQDGDTAKGAQFNTPYGIALDPAGTTLFVADRDNNPIR